MILVTAALLLATSSSARAEDNYFTETHYDLGIQSVQGLSFGGVSASGTAVHLTEHNGIISRVPYMLFFAFGVLQAGGDVRMVGSYSEHYNESQLDYVTGNGKVVDSSRIISTGRSLNVGFIPLTEEERAARDAGLERLGASMALVAMLTSHFDLMYLPNRDDGHLRGFRATLYPVAIGITRYAEIAVGYADTRLRVTATDAATGQRRNVQHQARAIAARVGLAPWRWLVLVAEYEANLKRADGASFDGTADSTIRGSAALSIPYVERLFCKLAAERIGLAGSDPWGTSLELGMRF
ncbi:MAG: hypothetical protein ACOYOB_08145 [Myxococcota bacterium]